MITDYSEEIQFLLLSLRKSIDDLNKKPKNEGYYIKVEYPIELTYTTTDGLLTIKWNDVFTQRYHKE